MVITEFGSYQERIAKWHDDLRNHMEKGQILADAWQPGGYEALTSATPSGNIPGTPWVQGDIWSALRALNEFIALYEATLDEGQPEEIIIKNAVATAAEGYGWVA